MTMTNRAFSAILPCSSFVKRCDVMCSLFFVLVVFGECNKERGCVLYISGAFGSSVFFEPAEY